MILEGHVQRIPKCYPVYKVGYAEKLELLVDHLKKLTGITPIGRYGAFKYNNQDHSILMGILAAEKIAQEKDIDLWSINTDYEDYQEKSNITATGLVRSQAD